MRPILLWIVAILPFMSPVGALAQDNGDGMYTNPPLYADYPDPDIIRGLRARGGYLVDVAWKDGKLALAVLHSELGNPARSASETSLRRWPSRRVRTWYPDRLFSESRGDAAGRRSPSDRIPSVLRAP